MTRSLATGPVEEAPNPLADFIASSKGILHHWQLCEVHNRKTMELTDRLYFSVSLPIGTVLPPDLRTSEPSLGATCVFCRKVGHSRPQCKEAPPCQHCGKRTHKPRRCRKGARTNALSATLHSEDRLGP